VKRRAVATRRNQALSMGRFEREGGGKLPAQSCLLPPSRSDVKRSRCSDGVMRREVPLDTAFCTGVESKTCNANCNRGWLRFEVRS
jgi:hypothetical protein